MSVIEKINLDNMKILGKSISWKVVIKVDIFNLF